MTLSRFAVKEVLQACSGHLSDIQDTATETRPEGLARVWLQTLILIIVKFLHNSKLTKLQSNIQKYCG
jgi:hypothetical protein